ncbi:hypothetical protein A3A93_05470 [Candidatus Roizmanbacteria bacterium RIFCSPLOWO2_01_FULL_38_12]|uniref:Glutaredoxin domain-containing protein n=1 Tax=Candidatus Roizmanbacteria bacterium RIFCSPLOWO2_01_FULL_38_12 TaxID=1802061 RepID=A0A1F7IZ32_9BACT|nr:MAG: hypothetical protein A2861_03685 [Candidatus Roizmanbacteria bacterium RIFCSPHIGHO2_01_FULL_38_15]OGK35253.1 MAG: hypothetical protein A3F59_06340 [Candidatus Roizmanbacteria bacterium RIFCSPHIGHO2_12_FULL_38_13]OGK48636.1 MAG: hypothetical protein A3A93_05470 [Candidatus Roizmanbacteria bacterium RIFCSPLOWO2_01_FULL_38_12]
MKVTIYTVTDCQFSKAEKEYLQSKNIPFEEKNLESNREFLTEMLNVSDNFAGTPVTKIEKDDGQMVVVKGFTKEEFDQALGFSGDQGVAPTSAPAGPSTPAEEVSLPPLPTQDPVPQSGATMPPASNTSDTTSPTTSQVKPPEMDTAEASSDASNPLITSDTSAPSGPIPAQPTQEPTTLPTTPSTPEPTTPPMTPANPNEMPSEKPEEKNNPMSSVMDSLQSKANS